ncbi:unnamed protein product [Acanthoscelides obtectus]|uniref:Uncharacterized protein n=1 Tax=Acanthoscelides obtectus TaxID=200917 RepID=A0A9P0JZG4_ACAOB|nr:unnamed protein product [Acanthoscelides obtectus]CAK1638016.1 hypothetical protein AOBTE_LOCUS10342 [Acanthoscelides obtectus]
MMGNDCASTSNH